MMRTDDADGMIRTSAEECCGRDKCGRMGRGDAPQSGDDAHERSGDMGFLVGGSNQIAGRTALWMQLKRDPCWFVVI